MANVDLVSVDSWRSFKVYKSTQRRQRGIDVL